jgi:FolB domain-containing protein
MKAILRLDPLRTSCVLGLRPFERESPQLVEVRVSLEIQIEDPSGNSSNTSGTVDWYTLANNIEALLRERKFFLAETAAYEIAQFVLRNERVERAEIEVRKFRITPAVEGASITVALTRADYKTAASS